MSNTVLFVMLIVAAAGLAAWGGAQLVMRLLSRDKRRIQERLTTTQPTDQVSGFQGSVTLQRAEPEGLNGTLARFPILRGIQRHLMQASPETSLVKFVGIAGGIGLAAMLVTGAMMDSAMAGVLAGAAGFYLPVMIIKSKGARRQRRLADQLPEALDFLARVLRAGHSLSTGMQMMGEELPQPLAGEFQRCYERHSLGESLEEAMVDMAGRVESTDFAFFVTAVRIQRQTGGDLAEVLDKIGMTVRQRIRLQQHVKAITAEGRFTGTILVAFPALLFLISYTMNPAYAGQLLYTSEGRMMVMASIVLQALGLMTIRKVTTVRV